MSPPERTPTPGGPVGWRERLLGARDRLGWWLLPLFVMVGLGGAVLAGSLAVVYYAQQVSQLESETRETREELSGAADEVRDAADEAMTAIDEEVAAVRDELARDLPLEDALEVGVVRLEVDTMLEDDGGGAEPAQVEPAARSAPRAAPRAQQDPAQDDTDDDGSSSTEDDGSSSSGDEDPDQGGEQEPQQDDGQDQDTAPPDDPPPSRQVPLRRSGTGFVVVDEDDTTFLVTSLGLLDDPRTEDRVPADVEVTVRLSAGATTATVHSWDEAHDLLLLRTTIRNVEPLPWREQGQGLNPGDRVVAVGTTPDLDVVRVGTELAGVSARALVTSLPPLGLIDGGPVVDVDGAVVGVALEHHAGLGGDPVVVPIRRLCDDLLRTCPD